MTDERGAEFRDGRLVEEGGRKISPRLIIAVVAAVIALIVVLQNTNRVNITFLFFDGTMHLWTFALLMILVGVGLGQLAGVLIRRRRRRADDRVSCDCATPLPGAATSESRLDRSGAPAARSARRPSCGSAGRGTWSTSKPGFTSSVQLCDGHVPEAPTPDVESVLDLVG